MHSVLRKVAGSAGFLLIWEAVSRFGLVDAITIPPPSVVLTQLGDLFARQVFVRDLVSTLLSWAIALGLATVIAVPLGLVLGSVGFLRTASSTIVEFLRPLPSVALIPLVMTLLGSGAQTKIALATFAAVWPILFNTLYALAEVDPQMVDTAKAFRSSRWRVLIGVTLPSVVPFVLTGVRYSASVALIVVVSVEYMAGGGIGLGQFITVFGSGAGRMDVVLACTLVAGLFGVLINAVFVGAQRRWAGWSATGGAA